MATYTDAATEQLSLGKSTLQLVETIEIKNSSIGALYYVNAPNGITATLEDGTTEISFIPANFKAEKPSYSSTQVPTFSLLIDGVDENFRSFLRTCNISSIPTYCNFRIFNATNLSEPMEIEPLTFCIGQIDITTTQSKIKAVFLNLTQKKAPLMRYTNEQFPSLS